MLRFFRKPALPAPSVARLIAMAGDLGLPVVNRIETEWCFYVATSEMLTDGELTRLAWLLGETFEPEHFGTRSFLPGDGTVLEIGPRLSFATAYATTATTICRACGLGRITRVERSTRYWLNASLSDDEATRFLVPLHDRMTQMRYREPLQSFETSFHPKPVQTIDVLSERWRENLLAFSKQWGLGWDDQDVEFLGRLFREVLRRNPTDVELFQLGQANSEHCRHWRFKGIWEIDGVRKPVSLMDLIKSPWRKHPGNSVIAFHDDASAIYGGAVAVLLPEDPRVPSRFIVENRIVHPTLTAETHNHPIMFEPYQGAMTKVGGVLRDQNAVGRGGRLGVCGIGFAVGNLMIPGYLMPWEEGDWSPPPNIATPLQIALRGSDGDFDYGNAFGQPVVYGFFRTFGMELPGGSFRSWFKPVGYGIACGSLDDAHVEKGKPEAGMLVALIGGPAYPIGVGGGSGSSMLGGENTADLDFTSVQRGDPEMERRLDNFMRACIDLREQNPIVTSHDLGAGGVCNAVPEIVDSAGARISLRAIPSGDRSMSTVELNGNEAQERNVILARKGGREMVTRIADRENVPVAFIGEITDDGRYVLEDSETGETPIDLPLAETLGNLPPKTFEDKRVVLPFQSLCFPSDLTVEAALDRVLRLPAVGSKQWLTRKVDRSVTGLVAQQQCVGPNHLPVADFAVKADGYFGLSGTAYALGEQPIKGLISPQAMVRLAVTEALLNLAGAKITKLEDIKGSANWMLAAKLPGQGAWLYDAMEALVDFMEELGIASDGGKDSLSMAVCAQSPADERTMIASPGEFVFAAYARMLDITRKVTPVLPNRDAHLLFVDLGLGRNRLGGSALAQAFGQLGDVVPDMEDVELLKRAFSCVQSLLAGGSITAAHDRSDGGLITTLLEMAFASNVGLDIRLGGDVSPLAVLFNEEPGIILGCRPGGVRVACDMFRDAGVPVEDIGQIRTDGEVCVTCGSREVLREDVLHLRSVWRETSFRMDQLQANPDCVNTERERSVSLVTPPPYRVAFTRPVFPELIVSRNEAPRVAIVREEGSNGEREMAALFTATGFSAWDVNMRDLRSGAITLDGFRGLAFPGGFSFRDVFDAGKGWAGVVRFNERVSDQFEAFRRRPDTFALGVCNGCQLMALLGWVPGLEVKPENQPRFIRNTSRRFESGFPTVKIGESPAMMLRGMAGSVLGVWVAHGEGRYFAASQEVTETILARGLAPLHYVAPTGETTDVYPFNPNGSPHGIAGLCSEDGRFLAMMPHPERTGQMWNWPWVPPQWGQVQSSPWFQLFVNAREWCEKT